MTTEQQIRANRENALRSTGPRTAKGKARSCRNAFRHGLSIPVTAGSGPFSEEVEEIALRMVEGYSSPALLDAARRVAETEVDLRRICLVRSELLSTILPGGCSAGIAAYTVAPRRFAAKPSKRMQKLQRLDRYERNALSKRKRLIRAFDAVLVHLPKSPATRDLFADCPSGRTQIPPTLANSSLLAGGSK
jgi:hypothetical protein